MKKQYSMKFSDYVQIKKPDYIFLKLIPSTSVKNNKASDIAGIINSTYVSVVNRFKKHNKGFSYTLPHKISFVIDIKKDNASFYIIIPKIHIKEFSQKLTETFGKITIEEVQNIEGISKDCTKYSLVYGKDDALSLAVDKRDNELLNANLSVMDILQDDDRLTILYNFLPSNKFELNGWKNYHTKKMEKYKEGNNLEKTMSVDRLFYLSLRLLNSTLNAIENSVVWFLNGQDKKMKKRSIPMPELSKHTFKKEGAEIIKTQIYIMSQSKNADREKENAKTLINTFSVIEDSDNKLVAKKVKDKNKKKSIGIKKKNYKSGLSKKINNTKEIENIKENVNKNDEMLNLAEYGMFNNKLINKMSTDEVGGNFINLAGRTLIEEYGLEAVFHNESIVPDELQGGSIRYGTNTYRGKETVVTLSSNVDAACMPEVLIARMGGGKSSTFENKAVDAINSGDSIIVIDFIKNLELTENIKRNIKDKSKIVEINLGDYMCQEGFGFNEMNLTRDMNDGISRYKHAILQFDQMMQFIDNLGEEEFSSNMSRYFNAACKAVLIHEDKSIRDVVRCIEDWKVRKYYMEELIKFKKDIPQMYAELIEEDITALEELNEYNKSSREIIGTNNSKITGIISRISQLKRNSALEFMYIRNIKNNINLVELMQEGKAIFFKLPQVEFNTMESKNIMVSYLFSKIMLSAEKRAEVYRGQKLKNVHVFCDEIQQAKGAYKNIHTMAYQTRKFRVKLIFATHSFKEIAGIKDILIDAGSGFMFLRGSSVKDFEVLQDEFEKFGFTKEDLINLSHSEKYKALCLIPTSKGRHACIVELLPCVANKIELEEIAS
jgi:hypothetical protein